MRQAIIGFAVAALLGGCAHFKKEDAPPVCDGKHRRPANAMGSVLTAPGASSIPEKVSAVSPAHTSFVRCGQ